MRMWIHLNILINVHPIRKLKNRSIDQIFTFI